MRALKVRRSFAVVGAVALAAIAVPLTVMNVAQAASGDPVVTQLPDTSGCNGVTATPGSQNTTKRLVSGDLEPGGTVTFQIGYPVDASDVSGRSTFVITDCVFIGDTAVAKYEVSFVPNTTDFILTFQLVIPETAPIGAEYCNYAKTTAAPSKSQASNRKANPACFHVGGDLRIIKQATGDTTHTPLAGAAFTVTCTTSITIPPVVISGIDGTTVFNGTTYTVSGTSPTGIIAIAGPAGTPCTVVETAPPPGYDKPANSTFNYTIPVGTSQSVNYISDPRSKNTTALTTAATGGTVGDAIHDVATVTGATTNPTATGTVTFNLYSTSDCSGAVIFTSTVPLVGGTTATSDAFTPTTAGSYFWTAAYSGDANNLAFTAPCGAANETSVLAKRTTGVTTVATSATVGGSISDTATVTGGLNPTGTVTFNLYGPSDTADCTGTAIFTSTVPL
ncbi:MAG: hypothetical protein ABR571_02885, partial [Jatrophihabitans sp.]